MLSQDIEVHFRKGTGKIREEFIEFSKAEKLFGHKFVVHEWRTKGAIDFIAAAIILYVPIKILNRLLQRLTEDIGDKIYDTFKNKIRDFFFDNNNNCNFHISTNIERHDSQIEVRITPVDLNHTIIDEFFNGFPVDFVGLIKNLKYPETANAIIYIDLLVADKDLRISWHSTETGRQYSYIIEESRWVDVTLVEYKCQYCHKVEKAPGNEFIRFNICPYCGKLYLEAANYIKEYFRLIQLSILLKHCVGLILDAKFDTAVREAIIILENAIKNKSGLHDLNGKDLISKAFSFEYDLVNNKIVKYPKIQLNDLASLSKRNEQEGVKLMLMGFMQGIRNIYMHGKGTSMLYYTIQIITLINIYLNTIIGYDKSIASYAE